MNATLLAADASAARGFRDSRVFALGFSFLPTVCGGRTVSLLQANRAAFSVSLLLVVLGPVHFPSVEFQLLFGICAPDPDVSRLSSAPEPSCSRALGSQELPVGHSVHSLFCPPQLLEFLSLAFQVLRPLGLLLAP